MLTATWCGPCKMLEGQTLPSPAVLAGLKEFVWVKAYGDAALNKEFNLGGYPTLLFLDASNGRVLERTTGYEPPGSFLRHVIAARRAAKLPLTQEMEELQAKAFAPDEKKIESLIQSGDTDGLMKFSGVGPTGRVAGEQFFGGAAVCRPESRRRTWKRRSIPIIRCRIRACWSLPCRATGRQCRCGFWRRAAKPSTRRLAWTRKAPGPCASLPWSGFRPKRRPRSEGGCWSRMAGRRPGRSCAFAIGT